MTDNDLRKLDFLLERYSAEEDLDDMFTAVIRQLRVAVHNTRQTKRKAQ